eukprot:6435741-Pyramimonas_sp.AAC.1
MGPRVEYTDLSVLCLSVLGTRVLFASISPASLRAGSRYCRAKTMLECYQVACFQEARGYVADLAILRDELRAGIVFCIFIEGSAAGGVVTYLIGAASVLSGSEGARCDRGQGIACHVHGRCGGPCDCERARAEHLW